MTRWRARYVGADGHEHTRHFSRKIDAQQWLDHETAKLVTGVWVDPKSSKLTVDTWCTTWLDGYRTRKPSTVRMAEVHIAKITEQFGDRRLDSLRPSDIKSWLSGLKAAGYAPSYGYALHARLAQILPTLSTMGSWLARRLLAAPPRKLASNGHTWPPPSRSGHSTMR